MLARLTRWIEFTGKSAQLAVYGVFIVLASARGAEDPKELLSLALRSPLERAGDYDALALSWLEAVPKNAADFRVELILRRLNSLRPFLRDEPALIAPLQSAMSAPFASGTMVEILRDMLLDLYRRTGRREEEGRLVLNRGYLLHWLMIGPFGKGQSSPFQREFPPEEEQKIDATYRDDWQELAWRPIQSSARNPLVSFFDFTYPSSGVVYLLAQVKSPEDRQALLGRGTSDSLKVWLNGFLVADDDATQAYLENRRFTGVRLARGWNRILVKARRPFWIRLSDERGAPFPPDALREEDSREIHPVDGAGDPRWQGPSHAGGPGEWAEWVSELESKAKAGQGADASLEADAHMGLALLEEVYERSELAVHEAEKALKLSPKDPWLLFHAGHIYRNAGYLPANLSKNRAKGAFEAVLQADPGFIPAYERMARFLELDEKYPQAALKMKEGLEHEPKFLQGWLRLKSIYGRREWSAEEIEVVKEIESLSPSSTLPASFWASRYRSLGNLAKAEAYFQKELDGDHRHGHVLQELAQIARERGDLKKEEALLRDAVELEPDLKEPKEALLNFLADSGRHEDALALAKQLAERNPAHPRPMKRVAELLEEMGKGGEAADAYRKTLSLEPGDLSLKRYLSQRDAKAGNPSGEDEYWTEFDEKLADWMPKIPTEGPLVEKASAIVVLDISVCRVEPDASYSEYVHQAFKLLSEESKEELAKVRTPGEPVQLRTLTAAGETLEPVAAEGKSSYVMPGLTPGALIEYAYRSDHRQRKGQRFQDGPFYFQDTRFEQPFLLSRFVVIVPKGFDAGFIENNLKEGADRGGKRRVEFARVERTTRELENGQTAYIFEARNVPRLERAQFLPPTEEYLPNLTVLEKSTWTDVAGALRARYEGSTRATPELSEVAAHVTAGIEDPLARARALYDHVNQLIPTESGGGPAVAILLEKAGDRTVLYKALLDLAKVPARWAFLRPQEAILPRTDWSHPRPEMFAYPYVALEPEGKGPIYVSLSQRMTPFGRLPEYLQGGKALVLDPHETKMVLLPAPNLEESAASIHGTMTLEGELEVHLDVEILSRSFSFLAQKDRLKTLPSFQRDLALRSLANKMFPGAKVKKAEFRGLEDPEKPFVIALDLNAPKALRQSGEDFLLKSILQPSQMVAVFCGRSEREHPFFLPSGLQRIVRDSLRIDAGKGYLLQRTPPDTILVNALGTYTLTYRADGNSVSVKRELNLLPGRLTADDFPAFVDFCEKVDASEAESVIFRKSQADR